MLDRLHEAPLDEVRVVMKIGGVQHGSARDTGGLQLVGHFELGETAGPRGDLRLELIRIGVAVAPPGEPRIVGQLGSTHRVAQVAEHPWRHRHDHHVVVGTTAGAGIQVDCRYPPGSDSRRRPSPLSGHRDPGAEVIGHRLLHRHLDALALAGTQPLHVRGQNRQCELDPGARVAGGRAGQQRRPVGVPRHRQRTRHRLRDSIEALAVRVGTGEAESLD